MAVKPVTGKTITYTQLCTALAEHRGMTNSEAKFTLDAAFDFIQKALMRGDNVATPLGKFKRADRAARMARNPSTGEPVKVKAKKAVKFTPNKALKEAMGG